MPEKTNLEPFDADLLKVVKTDYKRALLQWTLWGDTSLSRVRARERLQPSAPDLRVIVRAQRKNKHPHSTKKHK